MNIPGFTAESALYRSVVHYRGGGGRGRPAGALQPAQLGLFTPTVALTFQPDRGFSNIGTLSVYGSGFSASECVQVALADYQYMHHVVTSPWRTVCLFFDPHKCMIDPGGSFRVDFTGVEWNCKDPNDSTRITVHDPGGPGVFLLSVKARCAPPTGSPSTPCGP
jgi:hypothetical protein